MSSNYYYAAILPYKTLYNDDTKLRKQGTLKLKGNERNMGDASTAMIAERIPPCPTSHVVETLAGGERRNNRWLSAAEPISDSWPPPFEKDILLSSKLAIGTFGLLLACCPFGYQE